MIIEEINNKYHYALIRYTPDADRGEGLNIGIVVRNDNEQTLLWNKDFNPRTIVNENWNKSQMQEWEEFYQEEMTVMQYEGESHKLTEEYWDSIRKTCPENYVLGSSMIMLNNANSIEGIANYLFKKLVLPQKIVKRRDTGKWATDFFKKLRFTDEKRYKYPVVSQHEMILRGLRFYLPFYQNNGKRRAIWTAGSGIPQKGIKSARLSKYLSDYILLREIWGEESEQPQPDFILLTKRRDEDDPDIQAAEIAKIQVMPIDLDTTAEYFSKVCEMKSEVS